MLKRLRSQWVTRQERRSASMTGVAYRSDGSWLRVHMTNLSYSGCRLLTGERLDIGETLRLVLPQMQHVQVMVRWVTEEEAGVRFLQGGTAAAERRSRIGV